MTSNNAVRGLLWLLNGRWDEDEPIQDVLDILRTWEDVWEMGQKYADLLRYWPEEDYPPYWGPIHYDGIFFTEDARNQLINGEINFNGAITMGSNKFDGSRLWMADYWGWEDGMNPNDIKSVFTVGSRKDITDITCEPIVYQIRIMKFPDKDVKLSQKKITKQ